MQTCTCIPSNPEWESSNFLYITALWKSYRYPGLEPILPHIQPTNYTFIWQHMTIIRLTLLSRDNCLAIVYGFAHWRHVQNKNANKSAKLSQLFMEDRGKVQVRDTNIGGSSKPPRRREWTHVRSFVLCLGIRLVTVSLHNS